jgi:hypothetical protein
MSSVRNENESEYEFVMVPCFLWDELLEFLTGGKQFGLAVRERSSKRSQSNERPNEVGVQEVR